MFTYTHITIQRKERKKKTSPSPSCPYNCNGPPPLSVDPCESYHRLAGEPRPVGRHARADGELAHRVLNGPGRPHEDPLIDISQCHIPLQPYRLQHCEGVHHLQFFPSLFLLLLNLLFFESMKPFKGAYESY